MLSVATTALKPNGSKLNLRISSFEGEDKVVAMPIFVWHKVTIFDAMKEER